MKNKLIIVAAILLTFSCCSMWRKPLHFQRTDYQGNDFRMDGFYYSDRFCIFHFYRNGLAFGGGFGKDFNNLLTSWNTLIQRPKYSQQTPMEWGVFLVNYPEIKVEHWTSGSGARYPTTQYAGKILNDTTLLLTGGPYGTDTFHFHAMPTKPDSTTRFIN